MKSVTVPCTMRSNPLPTVPPMMSPSAPRSQHRRWAAETPKIRRGAADGTTSSASFESDPDLFSLDHHLLAVESVVAPLRECDGQRLCLDVVGVALQRASEHSIGVVARFDAILDVETELLPPILDDPHHFTSKAL